MYQSSEDLNRRKHKFYLSEIKFDKVAQTASDSIIIADEDSNIIFCNEKTFEIFGYTREELIGKNLDIIIPLQYREQHAKGMDRFLRTHIPKLIGRTIELEGLKKEGKLVPIELSLSSWNEGEIYFFCGIIRDISDKRKMIREMELHNSISTAISKSEDFYSALQITIALICEYTEWNCGEAWVLREDKTEISFAPVWYVSDNKYMKFIEKSREIKMKPGEGMPGRVINNNVEWVPDISKEPGFFPRRELIIEVGLKAGFGVPITNHRGEVFAALLFYFHQPRESDIVFINIVTSLATQLGVFLEKKQAQDALIKLNSQLEELVKLRTEELAKSEERYKTFVYQSSEGIFRFECAENQYMDINLPSEEQIKFFYECGYLAECNDAMARMYGFNSNEEIIGAKLDFFLPPDNSEALPYLKAFIDNGYRITNAISKEKDRYENIKYFLNNLVGIIENGKLVRIWGTQRDITEEKFMQEEKERTTEELRKTNIDLDNFIYSASHDLKAPISNIEGLINTLYDIVKEKDYSDTETNQVLSMIELSVKRFKTTIKDLSEIGKAQREIASDISEIDVYKVVKEVILSIDNIISETGSIIQVDKSCNTTIHFSKGNFQSIILNLLTNAVKYRSPDRQLVVHIQCAMEGNYYLLKVIDNGLGIREDQKDKIFGMFKRAHDHVEGTGVGLYLVRRMIENGGGKIMVESEEGKGSTFILYFKKG